MAAILVPLSWLGTPKDFWYETLFLVSDTIYQDFIVKTIPDKSFCYRPIAIGATVATGFACVLIVAASLSDDHAPQHPGTTEFFQIEINRI